MKIEEEDAPPNSIIWPQKHGFCCVFTAMIWP